MLLDEDGARADWSDTKSFGYGRYNLVDVETRGPFAGPRAYEHQSKIMDGRIAFFHVGDDAEVAPSAAGGRDAGSGGSENASALRPMRLPFLRRQGNRT